jgi:hypothetical protein
VQHTNTTQILGSSHHAPGFCHARWRAQNTLRVQAGSTTNTMSSLLYGWTMHGRNKRHLLVPRPTSDESTVRGFNLNIVLPAAAVFNIVKECNN